MNNLGKITIFLIILLLIFCFNTTRAERTELAAALPETPLEKGWNDAVDPGLSVEAGGSLSSIMRLVYADLDLLRKESTWSRLVRETIALNEGLVANVDPAELHDPAANRVEPGTLLNLPAIVVVEEGDTGIGRVLVRLNPKLKGNGRALIGAIKVTITANADLIRKTDVNQLYDGRFNVIVVGDVLILPPEVMPHTPARHPVQPLAMVAEKPADAEAAIPSRDEMLEETAEQVAAVVEPVPEQIEAAPMEFEPVAIVNEKSSESAPVESVAMAQTETAPVAETEETSAAPLDGTPFAVIVGEAFEGPIGLTARETRIRIVPPEGPKSLQAVHFLYAYLLAGLAFLGLLIILVTRWFERDREFRAQVNLFFTITVFLVTLGRVRRTPTIEDTEEEEKRLALPDPGSPHPH